MVVVRIHVHGFLVVGVCCCRWCLLLCLLVFLMFASSCACLFDVRRLVFGVMVDDCCWLLLVVAWLLVGRCWSWLVVVAWLLVGCGLVIGCCWM